MANTYGIFPAWIYYDRWSATYWVEEMKATGFTEMKGVAQGAKTLSLPMQFLGAVYKQRRLTTITIQCCAGVCQILAYRRTETGT